MAKYSILAVAVGKGFYTLAVIAVLNSVISLYYYLRLTRIMVFRQAIYPEKIAGFSLVNQLAMTGICLPVVFLGIFWDKLMLLAVSSQLLTP